MKVAVVWQRSTQIEIQRWIAALAATYRNGRELVDEYVAVINAALVATAGEPPGYMEEPGWDPPLRWWEFMDGWWISFTVQTRPRWWLKRLFVGTTKRITILETTSQGPA